MARWIKALLLATVLLFIATSLAHAYCDEPDRAWEYTDVVRIIMHERGKYTFMRRLLNDPHKQVQMITLRCSDEKDKIFEDVPPDKKSWVLAGPRGWGSCYLDFLEIHVHSITEIEGGGWDRAKGGKGTSVVIE